MSDERGSVAAVTDGTGAVLAVNTYDAYGLPSTSNNLYAGRFRYTGQTWLPEIGMYYYKARMYNPALGRFMQTDPIGYGDGMNMYAYVGNDPMNMTDPMGLEGLSGGGRTTSSTDTPKEVVVKGRPRSRCPSGANCLTEQAGRDYMAEMSNAFDRQWRNVFPHHPTQPNRCEAGQKTEALSEAVGAVGHGHGALQSVVEQIELKAGTNAARALSPMSGTLNVVSAGATIYTSLKRGEPVDVAIVRAGAPVAGSYIGARGGMGVGTVIGGGVTGGNAFGAGVGAVGFGIVGAIGGDIVGQKFQNAYAEARGVANCQ